MGKVKKQKNVKVANKRLNKLAKRGEFRKERKKKRIRLLKLTGEWKPKAKLQDSVDEELQAYDNFQDEDETLPLDMIDDSDDELLKSDFEQKQRRFAEDMTEFGDGNKKRKYLLPLKSATGQLIPQMIHEIEMQNEEESEPQESTSQTNFYKAQPSTSVVEIFANRCRSLKETKERIASAAHLLLTDPQENVKEIFS